MKITADPLHFAKNPPKDVRAILVYGPNRALVAETIATLRRHFLPGGSDDFSFVTITEDDLDHAPTRLADEMASFGFFAAKKILHVTADGEGMARAVADALDAPDAGHVLLLEGGELGPKSALRAWAEKADNAASVPCYALEGAALNRFIAAQFQKQGATIQSDAVTELSHRLGGDLSGLPHIVQQLIDYAGSDKPVIKTGDVEAMLVDQAEHELDAVVQALADANFPAFDRALHSLHDAGTSLIGVLRSAQNYFYKLRSVHADMKNGTAQEEALKKLRPPLFFKARPGFIRHLRAWPLKRVDRALSELLYLESMCKKTGTPELALIQQRLTTLMLAKAA